MHYYKAMPHEVLDLDLEVVEMMQSQIGTTLKQNAKVESCTSKSNNVSSHNTSFSNGHKRREKNSTRLII